MVDRKPATLIDKLWKAHLVSEFGNDTSLLYIDRLFLHERSGGRMLQGVRAAGRAVYDPDLVWGTIDHIIDTDPGRTEKTKFPGGPEFISAFRDETMAAKVRTFDINSPYQGIVHVIAPELGLAQPGMTLVCGDSHTCTMGGIGALAWGIGVTQGEHVLSTQTISVKRPRQMRITVDGELARGVTAKDLVLYIIRKHGARGGNGCAVEFAGSAIQAMSVEGRMTLCNMAVEFGAWTGIVAPDEETYEFVKGRKYAPEGDNWQKAIEWWRTLHTDEGATFDSEILIEAASIEPHVTWGTSSDQSVGVSEAVPHPEKGGNPVATASAVKALAYTEMAVGEPIAGVPIEAAFIGSCTNSRIEDLRLAAEILAGRRVAPGVKAICVPGSTQVKLQAEKEGLDQIFLDAGFEWRESGCSLCFYAGGDNFGDARRVISSTNRNFENRQGPGVKSHLASPSTVAASAIAGVIADPRPYARD